MGSGWLPAVDALGEVTAEFDAAELTGFAPPGVEGHSGKIRSVRSGDRNLLVFLGRTHFYEGRGVASVVHPVRAAAAAGSTEQRRFGKECVRPGKSGGARDP